MTVRSELKKLIDIDTYEESKQEDGSLNVFVRDTSQTGIELTFDAQTVKDSKQKELAELIAAHLGSNK